MKGRTATTRRSWGLWIAPGVFFSVEIEYEFEPAPQRVHRLMVPWSCPWNDFVLRRLA